MHTLQIILPNNISNIFNNITNHRILIATMVIMMHRIISNSHLKKYPNSSSSSSNSTYRVCHLHLHRLMSTTQIQMFSQHIHRLINWIKRIHIWVVFPRKCWMMWGILVRLRRIPQHCLKRLVKWVKEHTGMLLSFMLGQVSHTNVCFDYSKVYKARNGKTGKLMALKRIRMKTEKDGVRRYKLR